MILKKDKIECISSENLFKWALGEENENFNNLYPPCIEIPQVGICKVYGCFYLFDHYRILCLKVDKCSYKNISIEHLHHFPRILISLPREVLDVLLYYVYSHCKRLSFYEYSK